LRSLNADMVDFLDTLAADARRTIAEGYYDVEQEAPSAKQSLRRAIEGCTLNPVIAEVKKASPSLGLIRPGADPTKVAQAMEANGAIGISVLTEPIHFKGDIHALRKVREVVNVPLLMKDIILDPVQLKAAHRTGADAVLLIQALFDRGHSRCDLDSMIADAEALGLEVLLETHTGDEFRSALHSDADLMGINNRDLTNLTVDLGVTESILGENDPRDRVVVSESGIRSLEDIQRLREAGARAFLVGSAIMQSPDIGGTVRRLVGA